MASHGRRFALSKLRRATRNSLVEQFAPVLGGIWIRWLQIPSETTDLRERLVNLIPEKQQKLKEIKQKYGSVSLGDTTVNMAIGGMRGIKGMLWETSLLDAEEVPTKDQVSALSKDLRSRAKIPGYVFDVLNSLPKSAHPMTQLTTGVMALQTESEFQEAYKKGVPKTKYWEYTYEDSLNLIARLPELAAFIYRRVYRGGELVSRASDLDYGANFAHMLGFTDPQMHELFRLYLTIHSDHEGGNVSAHTVRVVGSALSDPYLSFAAGMNGLAGPLHGLANQEVLRWIHEVVKEIGTHVTTEQLKDYVWKTLKSGKVVPGYGHAVLRKTDPRYICQREFALKHLPNDPLFQLVSKLYEVVPPILLETGKVKNPWPNVDAHSGVLLQYFGLTEANYFTVLFGVSRAMGVLSQLIWDRALGLPIERPKSVTTAWIEDYAQKKLAGN
ncbi:hypothetical protein O6H91_06G020700 [Diphasiastrum complanatum]|uniref:Uncharacterized protein n=1 Tax=Diphasiastrum complanatum TaxID=34168 RepID=A0ACC2DBK9_DIPCM|nr:hypothetical protein O6H91_06G020700 [Diphasiastrum complanatum]